MSAAVRATRQKTLIFCQGLAGSRLMWQSLDLRPMGNAGGHDGTGRNSDDAVCQTTTAATDPPLSSDRGPRCRTAPAAPTGPSPDAVLVGDAGGHDGSEAVCQTTTAATGPPLSSDRGPGCRTAPAAPTGFVPNPDLQHAPIPMGDAEGHDGAGRDAEDGDLAACFEILEALRPLPLTGDAGCYR